MGKLKSYVMEQLELGYGVHPETLEPYQLEEEDSMNKYVNRYGDSYWFEPVGDSRYKFVMSGDWLKWCRFGGKEGQHDIDMNDIGMFDPSGGPYIEIGTTLSFGTVTHIEAADTGVVVTVKEST